MKTVARLFLSLLLLAACAGAAGAPLALTLLGEARCAHARITLGEVAQLPAGEPTLAALDLGAAPRAGYVERISRARIAQALAQQAGITELDWTGAASTAVRIRTQEVAADELGEAAGQAVRAAFGARYPDLRARMAAQPAALPVPLGDYRIVARSLGAPALAPRVAVWLDIVVDGAVYRSAVVPMLLEAVQPVYVARRAMAPGTLAQAQDFALRDENVATLAQEAAMPAALPARLRHALAPGQVLDAAALARRDMIYKGDTVRLLMRSGAFGIETGALALADAAPGQLIAVQPAGGREAVNGRAAAGATVLVEAN